MGINIDELREALGDKKPDEKIEIEREKLKLARERLDFEKEKHRDKERRAEAQNKPPVRDGRATRTPTAGMLSTGRRTDILKTLFTT